MAMAVAITAIAIAANAAERDDLHQRGEVSGSLGLASTSGSVNCVLVI
jgi:hypothetical protein